MNGGYYTLSDRGNLMNLLFKMPSFIVRVMEVLRDVFMAMFTIDSIWSIVLRGGIWFAIALVIIISADVSNPNRSAQTVKSNLGFFLLFLLLSGGLMYLLFGFVARPA